jgi:hypothetical protein
VRPASGNEPAGYVATYAIGVSVGRTTLV